MFGRPRVERRIVRGSARRTARRVFHRMELRDEDVKKIEKDSNQSAQTMTEEQLVAAMKKLGIKKLEVDDDAH